MDLTSFRRGHDAFAVRSSTSLDYAVLVATLEAVQSASATARAGHIRDEEAEPSPPSHDPLAELLLGGNEWRAAITAQEGCFNPAHAHAGDDPCP